jgi:hypothetical protein
VRPVDYFTEWEEMEPAKAAIDKINQEVFLLLSCDQSLRKLIYVTGGKGD